MPQLSSRREKRSCLFSALSVLFKPSMNWTMPTHILLFFLLFWLQWVLVAVCQHSLVAVSVAYSLVAAIGLLTVVASPVGEHRL